ncbi:hypothetical protein EE612_016597, partial [Oryza sativa]
GRTIRAAISSLSPPTPPPFPLAREHQISGGERGPRLARERKASGVEDADLREDADGEDHHPRGGEQRRRRQRQGQDPGQGRYPAGPAAPHLRREAAGGWPHAGRLQHPEGVHASPGASPTRRPHLDRALAQGPRLQAQHQQDGLQEVILLAHRSLLTIRQFGREFCACKVYCTICLFLFTPLSCRCYATLPPRATNCRKKKCGHSNQVSLITINHVFSLSDHVLI